MKKKYSKPELYIESFQLTQSIANRCGANATGGEFGTPLHLDKNQCAWQFMPGVNLWSEGMGVCNEYAPDYFEGLCYNNPNGEGIFAS